MYDEEKEFGMELVSKRTLKEYNVDYKDTQYIYTIDYNDLDQAESLVRADGEPITDQEQDEIIEIINNIDCLEVDN
jgi:hypothetical protein